jgi:hypothetical protein
MHADAARGAGLDVDRALLLQCAQVLLGGVHRAKPMRSAISARVGG